MVQRFWRNSCWVLLVGMLLGGGAALALEDSIDLLQAADFDHFVFLPLVSRPLPPGIHGYVNYLGEPIVGVTVTLFLHDMESRYPTAFRYTQTQADGDYHFADVPPLPPFCVYHVGYQNGKSGNPLNLAHLMVWNAPTILSYEVGQSVSVADFDVADVRQLFPAAGVTVTFPVTFTWEPRLVTPQDRYYCGVFMPGYMYGQGEVYWKPASADGVCVGRLQTLVLITMRTMNGTYRSCGLMMVASMGAGVPVLDDPCTSARRRHLWGSPLS